MGDLYGRGVAESLAPLTADVCTLNWAGGEENAAVQVSISYNQQINRRRAIGNKKAVIWASMPQGQITIGRLMLPGTKAGGNGFDACKPSEVTLTTKGACGKGAGPKYTAKGCIVTQYSVTLEAESLTVMDNIVIEFLTLESA